MPRSSAIHRVTLAAEDIEFLARGQSLDVTCDGRGERADRVGAFGCFDRAEAPQTTREKARREPIASTDRVDHPLDLVARDAFGRRAVGDERARRTEFDRDKVGSAVETRRSDGLGIVGVEQRPALLDAGQHDVGSL